jgi:hypothetical protein
VIIHGDVNVRNYTLLKSPPTTSAPATYLWSSYRDCFEDSHWAALGEPNTPHIMDDADIDAHYIRPAHWFMLNWAVLVPLSQQQVGQRWGVLMHRLLMDGDRAGLGWIGTRGMRCALMDDKWTGREWLEMS